MEKPQTWFCRIFVKTHIYSSRYRCELFYLCSCLSTQFLYRTAVKATFNVKEDIKAIIKNNTTLTINITTFPTKIRKIGGKTTSAYSHFLCQSV